MNLERRLVLELRADARTLSGYAAKFGVTAKIATFTETIRPGAFSASLASGQDVLALVDHDPGKVLARTKSGTLKLSEDAVGLRFELTVPDTQPGRDALELAKRGDLGGMSFGFLVPDGGDRWDGSKRTLHTVDLREISVVSAWPAYPATEVHARAHAPLLARALRYLETCR